MYTSIHRACSPTYIYIYIYGSDMCDTCEYMLREHFLQRRAAAPRTVSEGTHGNTRVQHTYVYGSTRVYSTPMYVYIYIYIYIYLYFYMYIYIYIYIYAYIGGRIYACTRCSCTHARVHAYVHVCNDRMFDVMYVCVYV